MLGWKNLEKWLLRGYMYVCKHYEHLTELSKDDGKHSTISQKETCVDDRENAFLAWLYRTAVGWGRRR